MSSYQMIMYYTSRTSINVMLCRTPYYGWVNDKFGTSIHLGLGPEDFQWTFKFKFKLTKFIYTN